MNTYMYKQVANYNIIPKNTGENIKDFYLKRAWKKCRLSYKMTEAISGGNKKCPTLHSDGHSISIGISFFKVKRLYSG